MSELPRATSHLPRGSWPAERASDSVTLDFEARHRRRIRLRTDSGAPLLLDLPRAVALSDGDGLHTEAGHWLVVRAASEPLREIRTDDPRDLVRLAWHIGNRHVGAEIRGDCIRIRPDHVLERMIEGLGGRVVEIVAPFQPEAGAYADTDGGGHAH